MAGMLNWIWLGMILIAVVVGGLTGKSGAVSDAFIDGGKAAVMNVALPLGGMFTLMLGMMRLVEKSGLIALMARAFRPLLRVLFPEIPADHPALGAMMMNMAANFLGAGNAATPFGLRAMAQLEKLNPHPGTATNAMCTFLVLNTSALTLISTTGLLLLRQYGASNPSRVIGPSIAATAVGLVVGLVMVKLLSRLPLFSPPAVVAGAGTGDAAAAELAEEKPEPGPVLVPLNGWRVSTLVIYGLAAVWSAWKLWSLSAGGEVDGWQRVLGVVSQMALPFALGLFVLYAALRGLKVFEEFIEGAKEGMQSVWRIIPYLVGLIVGYRVLNASGAIDKLVDLLRPVLGLIRFPAELFPMILMRPLSGSGSQAVLEGVLKQFGGDHVLSLSAATMYGSSETTFYVLAVYFGSVGIKRVRHALAAGLIADMVAMLTAVLLCRVMFS